MDPASKEYFHTFALLKEELHAFKSDQIKLKAEISKLFDENRRLTSELKENVQLRFQQFSESDIGHLEHKLQAAIAAKDAAVEMWQAALRQLEKQEELLVGKKSLVAAERDEVGKRIDLIKEEYNRGLNILSEELSNTRNELHKIKRELELKSSEVEKYKKISDSTNDELNKIKKHIAELSTTKTELEQKVNTLQSHLTDTEKLISSSKEEIAALKISNSELSIYVSQLEERNKNLQSEISIKEENAKESLLTAQEAVLQKKEMAYREEQYVKEIDQLKLSIDLEIEKVSRRYKSEIKEIEKQASAKIHNLMEEIQSLHRENSEKQSMFERAVRERQALESKFEQLYSESSSGVPVSGSVFDDMCKRLTMAERARDEFELKASSLETALQELRSAKEEELQYLQGEQNNFKERLDNLLKDFNQASGDRIKLCDEVTKLKKRCMELEKELKLTKARHANELSALEENYRQKQKSCSEQLHLTEEHYQKICGELQTLLEAELKINNRWKEEVDDLIIKSEIKIKELCQNVIHLTNQNSELVNTLQQNNIYVPTSAIYSLSDLVNVSQDARHNTS